MLSKTWYGMVLGVRRVVKVRWYQVMDGAARTRDPTLLLNTHSTQNPGDIQISV